MGECRDVTDQYQTGRSAYLRLGQLDVYKRQPLFIKSKSSFKTAAA